MLEGDLALKWPSAFQRNRGLRNALPEQVVKGLALIVSPGDTRWMTTITEIPVVLGRSVMHEISVNAKLRTNSRRAVLT